MEKKVDERLAQYLRGKSKEDTLLNHKGWVLTHVDGTYILSHKGKYKGEWNDIQRIFDIV